jgi:hypothetical protein
LRHGVLKTPTLQASATARWALVHSFNGARRAFLHSICKKVEPFSPEPRTSVSGHAFFSSEPRTLVSGHAVNTKKRGPLAYARGSGLNGYKKVKPHGQGDL